MLIAMNVILTRFLSFVVGGTIRIGFGLVPVHVAGYVLGPWYGLAVGSVSDLAGVLLNSFGQAPHLGFTLTQALHGFIPGLMMLVMTRAQEQHKLSRAKLLSMVALSNFLTMLLLSLSLQTVWVAQLRGNPYLITLASRVVPVVVQGAVFLSVEAILMNSSAMRRAVSRYTTRILPA